MVSMCIEKESSECHELPLLLTTFFPLIFISSCLQFTDGLVAAFHAVVRRTSLSLSQHAAGCVASSPIDPELQGMVEPKLLAQLTGAAAGEVAKLVGDDRKGFFHHEV